MSRTDQPGQSAVTVTHIFFDIGGVLGTGGWDTDQRASAARRFDLDEGDFTRRHQEVAGMLEEGRMTLDEYLDFAVFHTSRPFTRDAFRSFMWSQSRPFPETIALARSLAETGRYHLMTINNESAELNALRIDRFGLTDIFDAFFSSCWLGVAKPSRRIYEMALLMSQADPASSLFIDDRTENLPPAQTLGMHTVLYATPAQLTADLAALGVHPSS
jgi:putative hydrolase of the HAD superfamily